MVRFARAHGSKSSNARLPEEATPWKCLQQQHSVSQTSTNAETFNLNKVKASIIKAEDTCDTEWANIEDHPSGSLKIIKTGVPKDLEIRKKKPKVKKEKKDKLHKVACKEIKKQHKKDGKKLTKMLKHLTLSKTEDNLKDTLTLIKKEKNSDDKPLSKRKKRQERKISKNMEDFDAMTVSDVANATHMDTAYTPTKKQQRRKKHLQKKSNGEKPVLDSDKTEIKTKLTKRQKRNQKRLADSVEGVKALVPNKQIHKRRKPDVESSVIQINGQDVEVSKFDGFPVRKHDADRLKELQQQMIDSNIPLKDVKTAMKMERRKAEKAWAREKKNVCFQCRKSGHNLSECPDLVNDNTTQVIVPPSGICYKCGSTEHTHFECRVNRTQDFRFATCFICKEQGHISNQCPDNPRGLYPKGGACKVCGDVTHLKKDCPELMSKKEEQNMTVSTVKDNLEMLDEDFIPKVEPAFNNSDMKKIVKF